MKKKTTIGFIGLGKMGFNMVERLLEKDYQVVAFDLKSEARQRIADKGAVAVDSYAQMDEELGHNRLFWLMVPYEVVDSVIEDLTPHLRSGDTIIDGGNSPYKDSIRRAEYLQTQGVNFLDVGVCSGLEGARNGTCLMVGGERELYQKHKDLFMDLAAQDSYKYVGESGSAHFAKMIHDGIEYGMMQAIAEGFAIMKSSQFDLNLIEIADIYNRGSIIESRLIDWTKKAFFQYGQNLEGVSGKVDFSEEGLWTVEVAKELRIPVSVIEESLNFRIKSETNPSFMGQILSALRNQFGGHSISKEK